MTPRSVFPNSPTSDSPPTQTSAEWLYRLINRLGVGTKIGCGYALALSIAMLGTTAGLLLGSHYEQVAEATAEQGHETGALLGRLQIALGHARSHQQQFPALLPVSNAYKEEYRHFLRHIAEVNRLVDEIKTSAVLLDSKDILDLVETHESTIDRYFQQLEALLKQINPDRLTPEKLSTSQRLLLDFSSSPIALQYDEFSDGLLELAEAAFMVEKQAEERLEKVQRLKLQIIAGSILISALIALLLAYYTSRAIARPIQTVTRVAEKVTHESNFELQVPVTSEDEIGKLAISFNQLVQRVKQLLAEQQAATERERQLREAELIQTEKMSSLGRMMTGIAHEINNPVNFIYGNLSHASDYIDDLLMLLQTYKTEVTNPPPVIREQIEAIDLDFLEEDLPKVVQSMKLGSDRVRQIVLSLKNFARLDDADPHPVDLHECLDSTLLILNNRIKKGVTIVRHYDQVPAVEGFAGLLYQVFMNLLSNALDAVETDEINTTNAPIEPSTLAPDRFHGGAHQQLLTTDNVKKTPTITITTEYTNQSWVTVRIQDNGTGIPEALQAKIFDMFFTTKPRGVGTGMGLAISRQIITEKHNGELTCTSQVGVGTTFAIALPIQYHGNTSSTQRSQPLEV